MPCGVVLELLVDMRFQVLLTPLTGVLFTFPSRYLFTIGRSVVFSLARWSSRIQTGLHVSRPTWVPRSATVRFRVRDYHALWSAFPGSSANNPWSYRGPATPMSLTWHWFRLIFPGSLATTTGITRCFLFLRVLRCFTSPGLLCVHYVFMHESCRFHSRGFPHSDISGSTFCWQLPEAFRSHTRPSSPDSA